MASLPRLTYAPQLATEQRPDDVVRGRRIRIALRPPAALAIRLDAPKAAATASPGVIEIAGYASPPATYVVDFPARAPSNGRSRVPTFEQARSIPRWSASSWAIARPGGGEDALAAGGLLGGSQAGLRLTYALGAGDFAVATRLSSPLSTGRGGREAAFGIEWRPIANWPLSLSAERRVALDRRARDAFAIGLAGGVDNVALSSGFRLDAYAQAGVVGIRSRDAYVDGALRIERRLWEDGRASLALGAGTWGAAQPGAARLDVGPQAVIRLPTGATTLRIGIDWRQRVAGNARPGSGPAVSIGADF